ncbi:MAG: ABC transporter ATP-binding protein [Firmicutes bacterium]|nr:ABC transporter ATP-binding protein [Bacillota bacterium]
MDEPYGRQNAAPTPPADVISCENLVKIYKTKDLEVLALQGLDLQIKYGEMMAIIGNSGSGKSTLLNMIGGLDRPSAGRLYVDGKDLFKLGERELVEYKRATVGFVWQNNARNLIPYLTAIENVMLPMDFRGGMKQRAKREKAARLLALTGVGGKAGSRLGQLSGGEQQRVAIALALANDPKVLLADEPTGAVDVRTTGLILDVLRGVNKELGTTVVIVTHDRQLATKVNRVVAIRDGKTSSESIMRQSYKDALARVEGFAGAAGTAQEKDTHEEFAVLDRAGRVQVPREYLEKMGVGGNRIKMEFADGKVVMSAARLAEPEDAPAVPAGRPW